MSLCWHLLLRATVSPLMQGLREHWDQADQPDHDTAEEGDWLPELEGVVAGRKEAVPQFICYKDNDNLMIANQTKKLLKCM